MLWTRRQPARPPTVEGVQRFLLGWRHMKLGPRLIHAHFSRLSPILILLAATTGDDLHRPRISIWAIHEHTSAFLEHRWFIASVWHRGTNVVTRPAGVGRRSAGVGPGYATRRGGAPGPGVVGQIERTPPHPALSDCALRTRIASQRTDVSQRAWRDPRTLGMRRSCFATEVLVSSMPRPPAARRPPAAAAAALRSARGVNTRRRTLEHVDRVAYCTAY